jgi:hypothetical protein
MTSQELETQLAHEETMRILRAEFATKVWPKVAREIGIQSAGAPPVAQAAWLAFVAGKGVK